MSRRSFEQMLEELEQINFPSYQRWYTTPNPVCYNLSDVHKEFRNQRTNRQDFYTVDYYRQPYWMPQNMMFPNYEPAFFLRRSDRQNYPNKGYQFLREKRNHGEKRFYRSRQEDNGFRADRDKSSDFLHQFERRYQSHWNREAINQHYQLSRDDRNPSRLPFRNSNIDLCADDFMADQHMKNLKHVFQSRNSSTEFFGHKESVIQNDVNENGIPSNSSIGINYCTSPEVSWKQQGDTISNTHLTENNPYNLTSNFSSSYESWYCPQEQQQIIDMLKEVNLRHDRQLRRDILASRGEQLCSDESVSSNNDSQGFCNLQKSASSDDEENIHILLSPEGAPLIPEVLNEEEVDLKSDYLEKSASDFFEEFQNIFTGSPEKKIINKLTKENLKKAPLNIEDDEFETVGRVITNEDREAVKSVLNFDNMDLTEEIFENFTSVTSSSPKESSCVVPAPSDDKFNSNPEPLNNHTVDSEAKITQISNATTESKPYNNKANSLSIKASPVPSDRNYFSESSKKESSCVVPSSSDEKCSSNPKPLNNQMVEMEAKITQIANITTESKHSKNKANSLAIKVSPIPIDNNYFSDPKEFQQSNNSNNRFTRVNSSTEGLRNCYDKSQKINNKSQNRDRKNSLKDENNLFATMAHAQVSEFRNGLSTKQFNGDINLHPKSKDSNSNMQHLPPKSSECLMKQEGLHVKSKIKSHHDSAAENCQKAFKRNVFPCKTKNLCNADKKGSFKASVAFLSKEHSQAQKLNHGNSELSGLSYSEPFLPREINGTVYKRISVSEIFKNTNANSENSFKTLSNKQSHESHYDSQSPYLASLSPSEHLKQLLGIGVRNKNLNNARENVHIKNAKVHNLNSCQDISKSSNFCNFEEPVVVECYSGPLENDKSPLQKDSCCIAVTGNNARNETLRKKHSCIILPLNKPPLASFEYPKGLSEDEKDKNNKKSKTDCLLNSSNMAFESRLGIAVKISDKKFIPRNKNYTANSIYTSNSRLNETNAVFTNNLTKQYSRQQEESQRGNAALPKDGNFKGTNILIPNVINQNSLKRHTDIITNNNCEKRCKNENQNIMNDREVKETNRLMPSSKTDITLSTTVLNRNNGSDSNASFKINENTELEIVNSSKKYNRRQEVYPEENKKSSWEKGRKGNIVSDTFEQNSKKYGENGVISKKKSRNERRKDNRSSGNNFHEINANNLLPGNEFSTKFASQGIINETNECKCSTTSSKADLDSPKAKKKFKKKKKKKSFEKSEIQYSKQSPEHRKLIKENNNEKYFASFNSIECKSMIPNTKRDETKDSIRQPVNENCGSEKSKQYSEDHIKQNDDEKFFDISDSNGCKSIVSNAKKGEMKDNKHLLVNEKYGNQKVKHSSEDKNQFKENKNEKIVISSFSNECKSITSNAKIAVKDNKHLTLNEKYGNQKEKHISEDNRQFKENNNEKTFDSSIANGCKSTASNSKKYELKDNKYLPVKENYGNQKGKYSSENKWQLKENNNEKSYENSIKNGCKSTALNMRKDELIVNKHPSVNENCINQKEKHLSENKKQCKENNNEKYFDNSFSNGGKLVTSITKKDEVKVNTHLSVNEKCGNHKIKLSSNDRKQLKENNNEKYFDISHSNGCTSITRNVEISKVKNNTRLPVNEKNGNQQLKQSSEYKKHSKENNNERYFDNGYTSLSRNIKNDEKVDKLPTSNYENYASQKSKQSLEDRNHIKENNNENVFGNYFSNECKSIASCTKRDKLKDNTHQQINEKYGNQKLERFSEDRKYYKEHNMENYLNNFLSNTCKVMIPNMKNGEINDNTSLHVNENNKNQKSQQSTEDRKKIKNNNNDMPFDSYVPNGCKSIIPVTKKIEITDNTSLAVTEKHGCQKLKQSEDQKSLKKSNKKYLDSFHPNECKTVSSNAKHNEINDNSHIQNDGKHETQHLKQFTESRKIIKENNNDKYLDSYLPKGCRTILSGIKRNEINDNARLPSDETYETQQSKQFTAERREAKDGKSNKSLNSCFSNGYGTVSLSEKTNGINLNTSSGETFEPQHPNQSIENRKRFKENGNFKSFDSCLPNRYETVPSSEKKSDIKYNACLPPDKRSETQHSNQSTENRSKVNENKNDKLLDSCLTNESKIIFPNMRNDYINNTTCNIVKNWEKCENKKSKQSAEDVKRFEEELFQTPFDNFLVNRCKTVIQNTKNVETNDNRYLTGKQRRPDSELADRKFHSKCNNPNRTPSEQEREMMFSKDKQGYSYSIYKMSNDLNNLCKKLYGYQTFQMSNMSKIVLSSLQNPRAKYKHNPRKHSFYGKEINPTEETRCWRNSSRYDNQINISEGTLHNDLLKSDKLRYEKTLECVVEKYKFFEVYNQDNTDEFSFKPKGGIASMEEESAKHKTAGNINDEDENLKIYDMPPIENSVLTSIKDINTSRIFETSPIMIHTIEPHLIDSCPKGSLANMTEETKMNVNGMGRVSIPRSRLSTYLLINETFVTFAISLRCEMQQVLKEMKKFTCLMEKQASINVPLNECYFRHASKCLKTGNLFFNTNNDTVLKIPNKCNLPPSCFRYIMPRKDILLCHTPNDPGKDRVVCTSDDFCSYNTSYCLEQHEHNTNDVTQENRRFEKAGSIYFDIESIKEKNTWGKLHDCYPRGLVIFVSPGVFYCIQKDLALFNTSKLSTLPKFYIEKPLNDIIFPLSSMGISTRFQRSLQLSLSTIILENISQILPSLLNSLSILSTLHVPGSRDHLKEVLECYAMVHFGKDGRKDFKLCEKETNKPIDCDVLKCWDIISGHFGRGSIS